MGPFDQIIKSGIYTKKTVHHVCGNMKQFGDITCGEPPEIIHVVKAFSRQFLNERLQKSFIFLHQPLQSFKKIRVIMGKRPLFQKLNAFIRHKGITRQETRYLFITTL